MSNNPRDTKECPRVGASTIVETAQTEGAWDSARQKSGEKVNGVTAPSGYKERPKREKDEADHA
jgi:hypothetical protein